MNYLVIVAIALVTFITRIINLDSIPIFTDEAIYIRWAQIGLADPAHRFISLTDGKQPLFTWLMYPFLRIFLDPLVAGRFVSVLAGVFASVGIYILGRKLFDKKIGIICAVLYIITPFVYVYDRLALMDSLLAALSIWSLYLAIHLVQKPRLDIALLLGITAGLGMLTKSSAQFALILLPVSLVLFHWKNTDRSIRLFKWIAGIILSIFIAQLMYNLLRLSPWFYIIEQKNHVFILSFNEFFKQPFQYFFSNLSGMTIMLLQYLTIPLIVIILIGFISGIFQRDKKIVLLFFWFLIPFLILAGFGKIIFPRFMLFMVMPLLVIAADFIGMLLKHSQKYKWILPLIIVSLTYPLYVTVTLMVAPVDASIPHVDRNQLFDDWPSGFGVKSVIAYLQEKSEKGKIVVGTEGTFGLNPAVYEIYLGRNPNVEIHGYWPVSKVPEELLEASNNYPTYLIFKEKQEIPSDWSLRLLASYRRGKGNTYLYFYQVNPMSGLTN